MSTNRNFFDSPQEAAVYKHKLLKTYIPAWAGKVGSTSPGGEVFVYDAYAGPGRYANQEPGSPELLVNTALALASNRAIRTVFSDRDEVYCDRLRTLLAEKGVSDTTYEVRQGPVENHIEDVLALAGDAPLFVFLDPFGLTVPMDRLVYLLTARNKVGWPQHLQPKTELLMNFSYEAVRRIAGALMSEKQYKAKDAQIATLDAALGGDWWHAVARGGGEGWADEVLAEFAKRVAQAAGYGCVTADVADSLSAKPVYELILWTPHRDGLWKMAEAMSHARQEWRRWLRDEGEAKAGGQQELARLQFDDDEQAWAEEIARNVGDLLTQSACFVVEDRLDLVLGRTLGLARETHIRRGLRILYDRGVIAEKPIGSLQRFYIARK